LDLPSLLTIIGIVVPVLAGALMAMFPAFRLLGWIVIAVGLAILGYAIAAFVTGRISPERLAMPFSAVAAALGFALVIATGLAFDPYAFRTPDTTATPIRSVLRLQFYGDERVPTAIENQNVATWYTLYSPRAAMISTDNATGKKTTVAEIPKSWAIFMTFDRPTTFNEVTVSLSSPGLPAYDIKQTTTRSVLVTFSSDIPAGTLEIATKN
jgi:hypothetical protein